MPRRSRAILFAVVFLISFGVYLRTLAPTVALNDSGALTLAAWSLGNAHPPGVPLYVLVTHVALLLPIGSVIWRANLASAFFAALACGIVSLTVFELLGNEKRRQAAALHSLTAGLLLAFGRTLWNYATIAEVYALNATLIALILWTLVRWRSSRENKTLYLLALLSGLALGVHYVTVAFVLFGALVFIWATAGLRFFVSREAITAALITIATAAIVYAYLPIAAARMPFLNWGDPSSVDRFIGVITARQFRVFVGDAASGRAERTWRFMLEEFGSPAIPIALLIATWGLIRLFRRDHAVFAAIAVMTAACAAWLSYYDIIFDADAYLLPAYIGLAIAFAFGAASIARGNSKVAAVFLLVPAFAIGAGWKWRDRSSFRVAEDFAQNTLREMKGDSLLITESWQLYSPLLYFQEVEKQRPDVKSVLHLMLFWPWYLDTIERHYPEVAAPVRATIAEFRPQSIRYERDLKWRRAGGDLHLLASFDEVVFGLIASQLARGGRVFITPGILLDHDPIYLGFVQRLLTTYEVVPYGMVVEVTERGADRTPELAPIELRGIKDGSMRYDADDAVVRDVIPTYSKAFQLRGRYLAITRRFDESLAAYRQALALAPDNPTLQQELRAVERTQSRR